MTYLDFSNTYGNMCNHFYLAFQAFQASKKTGTTVKYIKTASFNNFRLQKCFELFNLSQFIEDADKITQQDHIIKNTDHWTLRYHQCIFVDFNIENIENFIRETFLKSNLYDSIENLDDSIAIHIRNGDYIQSDFNCFDRKSYIEMCLERIDSHIKELHVFSDDINVSKNSFGEIFSRKFKNVVYENGNDPIEDFVNLSKFKNKILWNSTFSYWAAFIGNVIHQNSYENVFAPSRFTYNECVGNHVNPMWRIINV